MNKTAKGALAAAAAAVALMGGVGSLAYWNDAQTVDGTTIDSGRLALDTDATNTGCGGWTLDGGDPFVAGTTLLVPGDSVSESCSFTLTATGDHMSGTVSASTPTLTGTLASALQPDVSDVTVGGVAATSFTGADNGKTVGLVVTVTLPADSDNTSQDLTAALSDVTITVSQQHA
jgi:alternate signal-mediated exported protein